MAVFSAIYPSILYFIKTIHRTLDINAIPPKLTEPSCVISELLEIERSFARGNTNTFPSKKFMKNHNNIWVIMFTTEAFDLSKNQLSNNAISKIINEYDCTKIFVITQHQMQTDYVTRLFPSLNIIGTYNEWEYFSYINTKNWTIKDPTNYIRRFAFMNRRNDKHRSNLFYNLWNIDKFPENTFASFNPGNYWSTMGLVGNEITESIRESWQHVLSTINDQSIVTWFKNIEFPQLPPQYSEQTPMNYHWEGNPGLCALMHDTGISIVAETVTYPSGQQLFTTEKIFRPIMAGQPFITLASQWYLKNLRSLGYRTFGDIWDEHYDSLEHVNDRINAIRTLVQNLNNMSSNEFDNTLEKCREICAHNREIMKKRTSKDFILSNIDEPFRAFLNRDPYKYKDVRKSRIISGFKT